jgi:hydrogenase expression/formation protein HypD
MTAAEAQWIERLLEQVNASVSREIRIMEVCGTHTHQIARYGIRGLLSPKIRLVSGPGCPVCVTEPGFIDTLITLLQEKHVTVVTFGDLLRVHGLLGSLEEQRALGRRVLTVYSPEDALHLAKSRPDDWIVFAAVGFETTAPLYGALLQMARGEGVRNLSLLTSLRRMEPAIRWILEKPSLDGMLCPGHVAAITGTAPFLPIAEEYGISAVICGFEAMDLVASISLLCRQITGEIPVQLMNPYRRCVDEAGNPAALGLIHEVFTVSDISWRGIGTIKDSGLILNRTYEDYDAVKRFGLDIESAPAPFPEGCACGAILIGEKTPELCVHFGVRCTPEHPIGPCMVSSEGACAAYYRYGGGES